MKYTPIEYDNWNGPDGWTVNDVHKHDDIEVENIDSLSDRELFKVFAQAAGFKTSLRSIQIEWCDESFIEFVYTARSVHGFFPLGRLELNAWNDE